jgi:two-component system, chemotaxis family, chemotaxis protein CheY
MTHAMHRILAIDDSATMRAVLDSTLSDAGYEVSLAPDGEIGLELAASIRFDLILTDQNMPHKSGLEVISTLRQRNAYLQTPIFVLTTESSDAFKAAAAEAGATGWIEKPFDPETLTALVASLADPAGDPH